MQVLNIPVSPQLMEEWRGYLAPSRQPFFLTAAEAEELGTLPTEPRADLQLSAEERDTYHIWSVDATADRVVWVSREEWSTILPAKIRRDLLRFQVRHSRGNVPLGRHFADLAPGLPSTRFLWEPLQLTPEILARIVSDGQSSCQRGSVPQKIWQGVAEVLPRAQELAGTFPRGSNGNCFGTVMGAAGVAGAENEWMQREPFEAFLRDRATRGGRDDDAGTLLVWRSRRGVEHAAVTLGSGWAFHKANQTWMTPRTVLGVEELKRGYRTPGHRLERWRLQ